MNPESMDRILATEEELVPSSGFLASVMERVQEEASAPPPIPFPWLRAIPALVLATAVLGWGGYEFARFALPAAGELALASPRISATLVTPLKEAGWVAGSLAASLLCWLLSRRLVGRSGLL